MDAKPTAADEKPRTADAKPTTADAKPTAADAKPTATEERLEDKKTEKTTGVAGSYKTGVLSAAGLDPAQIGDALSATATKLDSCFSAYLSTRPPPGLRTAYDVVVDAKGKLESAKLRSGDIKSAPLHKCLETTLRAVAWPKPTEKVGKTTVEWTLGT